MLNTTKKNSLEMLYKANSSIEATSNIYSIIMKIYSLDSVHFKNSNGILLASIEYLIIELFQFEKVKEKLCCDSNLQRKKLNFVQSES